MKAGTLESCFHKVMQIQLKKLNDHANHKIRSSVNYSSIQRRTHVSIFSYVAA